MTLNCGNNGNDISNNSCRSSLVRTPRRRSVHRRI
nr:MAG TPA_asm: hypothetical protein [Caudoviricetes sp.]